MDEFYTLRGGDVDVGGAPEVISILPMGRVISDKGTFLVDGESLGLMKDRMRKRGVDLVVDYEHQTLTGARAPAAGWVSELFEEDGFIRARVRWTPKAAEYLANREYRYLSPVITVRRADGKATGLHSLALTNTPAIEGMPPIVNSSTFRGGANNMEDLISTLAAMLELPEGTGGEQIAEAVKALLEENRSLREKAGEPEETAANKAVLDLLGLQDGATTADAAAAIMALKGGIDGRVKALEDQLAKRDAEEAVETALKAGKITPAMRDWAVSYALKSPEGFREFAAKAPQAVPMGEAAGGTEKKTGAGCLDEAALLVCRQLGLDPETVAKYNSGKED